MKLKVLFFGKLADVTESDNLEMKNIFSIAELINDLITKYPQLKNEQYKIAVNRKIENNNIGLIDGDEIALLPPFAGG
ncbi:MAG: MoaD/ThiS family protein [Bacteroidota bacterium]